MKLREYNNEEINTIWDTVKNMKDWKLVSCVGLCQRTERNSLMMDNISFYEKGLSKDVKNSVLNSIEAGETPKMLSLNGCHETYYMYELNGVKFFSNADLNK